MGVAESTHPHTFLTQLTFIETCQDKHFGAIDLYRTKESPYEYVMDFKKTFIEENERVARHLRVVGQLKHMEHKNLAKIHHSELIECNSLLSKKTSSASNIKSSTLSVASTTSPSKQQYRRRSCRTAASQKTS